MEAEAGDAGVFLVLVQLQRGEVELFSQTGTLGTRWQREWWPDQLATCQDMQRYSCSFSRVRLSFTVFLHIFICFFDCFVDCFCMFLHWHVPPSILVPNTPYISILGY